MTANAFLQRIDAGLRIGDLPALARDAGLETVDARILISHALDMDRISLITRSDDNLTSTQARQVQDLLNRRLNGEPVAYLIGQREFFGLTLQVTPDVLIPRPETELLVELALERLPRMSTPPRVLDLGTGSGAIAVAIAHVRPDVALTAVDISAAAIAVASINAAQHTTSVQPMTLLQSDWYEALADQSFEIIVSNPPYIAAGDWHLNVGDLRFEPAAALTDNHDGLSAYRTIISGAPRHLADNGWLLMEHGYDQSDSVRALLQSHAFADVQSWRDLAGIERVSGGRWLGNQAIDA